MIKTIFIPIFQGVEARNILRTDIFRILKNHEDLRIVLFVLNQRKKEYFEKEFSGGDIHYEVFDHYKNPSFHRLFTFLKFILINTSTMDIIRRVHLKAKGRYLNYYFKFIFNRVFARKFFRKIARRLDWFLVRDDNFKEFFDKYNPDLVFLAHIFGDEETSMLRQAKKRNIKTIGIINSWDKITSRCMIRLLPDKLIVHNDIIKKEAIKYVDMPEKDIEVTGVPHYDIFFNSKPSPKEEFYTKMGADIGKRIILFCPLGKFYSDIDADILNVILSLKSENQIPSDTQILVRFPPNDIVNLEKNDKFIFYQPGIRFTAGKQIRVDWDMDDKEIQILLDTLYHSSLVICLMSSISIDASIFDKPIINIKFERLKDSNKNANIYYGLEHYKQILDSGGVRLAINERKLLKWINRYLAHPEIDREGRKEIVKNQCWKTDGKAGERAADFIIRSLNYT